MTRLATRMAPAAAPGPEGAPPAFLRDVLDGLARAQKAIPSRWLYDRRGSELFEEITRLPEYYPTRTEIGILHEAAPGIAAIVGPGADIVEYGAGSARKTSLLLDALEAPGTYVPVDISEDYLAESAAALAQRHAGLSVRPLAADFMEEIDLGRVLPRPGRRLGFFPGSTIGNLSDDEAEGFLARTARQLGRDRLMVIGVDLEKDPDVLIPAYDDAAGVTAAFNLNLLGRINRELDADFDLDAFAHEARWNAARSRIEMHLVSRRDQIVRVGGKRFGFRAGETIHTENSRKFGRDRFAALAGRAGWSVREIWTDSKDWFAVLCLER